MNSLLGEKKSKELNEGQPVLLWEAEGIRYVMLRDAE